MKFHSPRLQWVATAACNSSSNTQHLIYIYIMYRFIQNVSTCVQLCIYACAYSCDFGCSCMSVVEEEEEEGVRGRGGAEGHAYVYLFVGEMTAT